MGENFLMPEASHAWHVSPLYLLACHLHPGAEMKILIKIILLYFIIICTVRGVLQMKILSMLYLKLINNI